MKVESGWLVEGPPMASSGTVKSLPEMYKSRRSGRSTPMHMAQMPHQHRPTLIARPQGSKKQYRTTMLHRFKSLSVASNP
jgi:hypothetical protein